MPYGIVHSPCSPELIHGMKSSRVSGLACWCALACAFGAGIATAQGPPAGYYASVDPTDATTLRSTLHDVIDDHTKVPYSDSSTDTWDVLEVADEDPGNSSNILDLYRNQIYAKQGGGNGFYNREHSWPRSYGFPDDGDGNYPFSDCHHLFLCDITYNSIRDNKPFRICTASCDEYPTEVNAGSGGGTGLYPGNSNWSTGASTAGTWEVWGGRRGDVARALFYMDIRYEGGNHGQSGFAEPDLILTDNTTLIASSSTGSNESVAYMGLLSVLLQWHAQDPPDAKEMARNDAVFATQGNRNPFIDHPEWVDGLHGGGMDMTPPGVPTGLTAMASSGMVDLDWDDNAEADLAGYLVYRSTSAGGPYTSLNMTPTLSSVWLDSTVMNNTTYFYGVSAVDFSGNESTQTMDVSATPTGQTGSGTPWINEFHYDNSGTDVGEFVEIAGPAGTDLSGWSVVAYNGSGGIVYGTLNLTGSLPNQGGCTGTLSFSFAPIQNGLDGLALVDPLGTVVEFLSYEGSFTAVDGPASGQASEDIGVFESSGTAAGLSLQRTGAGSAGPDFTWQSPSAESPGALNVNQSADTCTGLGTNYCVVSPNSQGAGSMISASGSAVVSQNDFTLSADGLVPNSFGLFFYGPNEINAPFGEGRRCVGGATQRLFPLVQANTQGISSRMVDLTLSPSSGNFVPSSTWKFQLWYRDGAGGPAGFNLSDGLSISWQ